MERLFWSVPCESEAFKGGGYTLLGLGHVDDVAWPVSIFIPGFVFTRFHLLPGGDELPGHIWPAGCHAPAVLIVTAVSITSMRR